MIITEKQVTYLQDLIKTQSSDGNYNFNPYMFGLANGLILALSVLTGERPIYLDKPEKWLEDENIELFVPEAVSD